MRFPAVMRVSPMNSKQENPAAGGRGVSIKVFFPTILTVAIA